MRIADNTSELVCQQISYHIVATWLEQCGSRKDRLWLSPHSLKVWTTMLP